MANKTLLSIDPSEKAALADRLANSRKYRPLNLPRETFLDLIEKAAQTRSSIKDVDEVVRRKLHNLVAPYLGDPPYEQLVETIPSLPLHFDHPAVRQFCLTVLNSHSSTRERIPIQEEFYQRIFSFTGKPAVILDLACGLNPFSLPWMRLPSSTSYLAYDLHQPRIDLIAAFLNHFGHGGAAIQQDILLDPPQTPADVAFFFKEAHRFEQRESGCVRTFLERLPVKFILLSLPAKTLTGRRSMLDQDRRLVDTACAGQPWGLEEMIFPSEIVFCIQKAA